MDTSSRRLSRQVDLNLLSKDFTTWYGKHQDLVLQNNTLREEILTLTSQAKLDKKTENTSQVELNQLHEIISGLQDSVTKKCNLEDENKQLKETIQRLKEDIDAVKEEGKEAITTVERQLEEVHAEHTCQIEETHQQAVMLKAKELTALEKEIRVKSAENKQLKKQFAEAEKGHQTGIVKLRLEYDAKLLKLQSANTRTIQRNEKPVSVGSHIFREKMLNAQAASEREVAHLKQTVNDLKRKLSQHSSATGGKRKL
ncbi:coiled-coil domain-containing protein 152-like [Asterias rubens]|uniref:coiled-coil domain-containing protein 152-like n=1 Tax=Asterias rubens TaxID=7604 RepID=UPI001454F599|nr:coiled-coil domain-containing protein 152-like [Asterias rubens]